MDKNVYMMLLMIIFLSCINHDCFAQFSLSQKIKSFFTRKTVEKVEQKEIPVAALCSLSLSNIHGSVSIKSGPQKSIFLKSIKHAKTEALLDTLAINVEITHTNHLGVFTSDNNKKNNSYVDYELIVPAFLDIAVNITGKGKVLIKDIQGAIDIVANDNITVLNTKKRISAQTLKKGSITIANACGPVEAYTLKGSIFGENITNSFDARSIKGKMNIAYKKVSAESSINLTTTSGNIILALPMETNATICGNTMYGTLLSDHEITLNPYSTKLNKNAWSYFTKHVEGILGSGDASIKITSTKGNVRIVETAIT